MQGDLIIKNVVEFATKWVLVGAFWLRLFKLR